MPLATHGYGDKLLARKVYDVAYCECFAANLVSFRQLRKLGYWWDTRLQYNWLRHESDSVIAYTGFMRI